MDLLDSQKDVELGIMRVYKNGDLFMLDLMIPVQLEDLWKTLGLVLQDLEDLVEWLG